MNAPSDRDREPADGPMRRAIELAVLSVDSGGGPFGAVIVRGGRVVAEGVNQVVASADPTAHAEIAALRAACRVLGTHVLRDCVLYSSCEPCPMCLGAVWWARISRVFYGASRQDAEGAGFDDAEIYAEMKRPVHERRLPLQQHLPAEAQGAFEAWEACPDRRGY